MHRQHRQMANKLTCPRHGLLIHPQAQRRLVTLYRQNRPHAARVECRGTHQRIRRAMCDQFLWAHCAKRLERTQKQKRLQYTGFARAIFSGQYIKIWGKYGFRNRKIPKMMHANRLNDGQRKATLRATTFSWASKQTRTPPRSLRHRRPPHTGASRRWTPIHPVQIVIAQFQ